MAAPPLQWPSQPSHWPSPQQPGPPPALATPIVADRYLTQAQQSTCDSSIDEHRERQAALQRREEAESQGRDDRDPAAAALRAERVAALDRLEDAENAHATDLSFDWSSLTSGGGDTEASSIDRPLPPSNVGFRLLVKMGWGGMGRGLGRRGQGIAEPIRMDTESGALGMGLGKKAEMEAASDEATAQRRVMQVEAQATESAEQRAARESAAAAAARISVGVAAALHSLRCDDCNKQYNLATELEAHLSSYDHNHVVRMNDMRRSENARKMAVMAAQQTARGADSAATRRQQKEDQRIEAQMRAAAAAMQPQQQQQQQLQRPPPPPPPPRFAPPAAAAAATPSPATATATAATGAAPFSFSLAPSSGSGAPTAHARPAVVMKAAIGFGFGGMKKTAGVGPPLAKPKFAFSTDD